jgi:prepilin-type N-terminal cleavage/methylation domain-containing protein
MNTPKPRTRHAFTMVELLTVIAIIAILAAILFPIFGTVREQTRQSGTMSNMHSIYVAARMFYEDEGRFPNTLFGYAEVPVANATPPFAPAVPGDPIANVIPMDQMTGVYQTTTGLHRGYLFREQVKDFQTFLNSNDPARNRKEALFVYWPINSPMGAGSSIDNNGFLQGGVPVDWMQTNNAQPCPTYGDSDLPNVPGRAYLPAVQKMFYRMDSMDIGPMLTREGKQVLDPQTQQPVFELHYSPDWTHKLGGACDADANGNPYLTQLKYKNPPRERTILTYNTHHAAFGGSPYVLILRAEGTARKMNVRDAFDQLPLNYR